MQQFVGYFDRPDGMTIAACGFGPLFRDTLTVLDID